MIGRLHPNLQGAAFMTLSMAAYTVNDTFVKLVADSVPLFQIVFLRGLTTTILLAGALWHMGMLRVSIPVGSRVKVTWRSVFEVASTAAFLIALINMPIANATAILSALPLAVTLGAWLFLGDPIGWPRLIAILVGFLGVMLIVQPGTDGFNAYALLAVLAVGMVTARDLVTRQFSAAVSSGSVAIITAAAVGTFGGVMSLFGPWVVLDLRAVGLILAASMFILWAYLFSIMAMRAGEISFVSPFRYTALVWALILGVLVFGEFPNTLALIGAAIVVATGLFTFWRERNVANG